MNLYCFKNYHKFIRIDIYLVFHCTVVDGWLLVASVTWITAEARISYPIFLMMLLMIQIIFEVSGHLKLGIAGAHTHPGIEFSYDRGGGYESGVVRVDG